jgi:hypothetical protein
MAVVNTLADYDMAVKSLITQGLFPNFCSLITDAAKN